MNHEREHKDDRFYGAKGVYLGHRAPLMATKMTRTESWSATGDGELICPHIS